MKVRNQSVWSVSERGSLFLFLSVCGVLLITLLVALCLNTPLFGITTAEVGKLNDGWAYSTDGNFYDLDSLPCRLNTDAQTIRLKHALENIVWDEIDVLTVRSRYESIRVLADDKLIYTGAAGEEHALGSMWHFISMTDCKGASNLYVEITRYNHDDYWNLSEILLDRPGSIQRALLCNALPNILFWLFTMLFTFILLFAAGFMAVQKIPGIARVLSLAAFVFLSGLWILLDSKITTIFGGNYAITYFFSYAAFYLLMVPYLLCVQYMLGRRNRVMQILAWLFLVNAAVCMLLHLFGIVPIRKTAFIVHILIFISLFVSVRLFWHSVVKEKEKKLVCTFIGSLLIYAAGIVSIILYYIKKLPPANSTVLYSWGLLIMIIGMMMDAVFSFSYLWKQKQEIAHYRKMAVRDDMTKMGNRNAYEMRIMALSEMLPERLSFLFFDIDNLKYVNDTYGHLAGDHAIQITASCIRDIFKSCGECYRIGGDEFCVILTEKQNLTQLSQAFDALLEQNQNAEYIVSVSYGWAEKCFDSGSRAPAEEIAHLQKKADEALYHRKRMKK